MDELFSDIDRIMEYRTVLCARIRYFLVAFDSEATVEDIRKFIFERDGASHFSDCFVDIVILLNAGEEEFDFVLPLIQEAWNYFPHRCLGGRCPAEAMVALVERRQTRRQKIIKF